MYHSSILPENLPTQSNNLRMLDIYRYELTDENSFLGDHLQLISYNKF